jgi:hypothetical protein
MARLSHGGWRRIVGCVLAYALALQGFILALDTGRPASAAGPDPAWSGFELCTHSSLGSAAPGTPSQSPVGDDHCVFCTAGAVYVSGAPPDAPQYSKVVLADVAWLLAAPRLVAFSVNENAWPRGPPAAA